MIETELRKIEQIYCSENWSELLSKIEELYLNTEPQHELTREKVVVYFKKPANDFVIKAKLPDLSLILNFYERNDTKNPCPILAFDILNTYLFAAWRILKKNELPEKDIIQILTYNWDNRLFDLVCEKNNQEKPWEIFCQHKNKNSFKDPIYAGICAEKILRRILEKFPIERLIEEYESLVPALDHSYLFSFSRLPEILKKIVNSYFAGSSSSKKNDEQLKIVFSFLNQFFALLKIENPDPFYFKCLMNHINIKQLFSIFWHYLKANPPANEEKKYEHSCHWLANCIVLTENTTKQKIPFVLKWQLLTFYYKKYRRMPSAERFFADIETEKRSAFMESMPLFFPDNTKRPWQILIAKELKNLCGNNHQKQL